MRISTDANFVLKKAAFVSSLLRRYDRWPYDQRLPQFQPEFEYFLYLLQTKGRKFDFIGQLARAHTLLVGEGNFSFSRSLLTKRRIKPQLITATVYEFDRDLSDEARKNARLLRSTGARVRYGVNATRLKAAFGTKRFDSIVFMFPNVASRKPIRGRNPNFVLVRDFLRSSAVQLTRDGCAMITAVNSPHYLGAFNFPEAAMKAGFHTPEAYPFDPSDFAGYEHTMTHQDENGLEDHDRFSLWVFRLK